MAKPSRTSCASTALAATGLRPRCGSLVALAAPLVVQLAPRLRRYELCHHAIAVGDQHGLAAGGKADVFTELVFEHFEADGAHSSKVATGSYLVNSPGDPGPAAPQKVRHLLSRAGRRPHRLVNRTFTSPHLW